jgi:hypothetical protein
MIALLEKLGAGAGIIVVLILLRLLVPGYLYRDKAKDAETWKGLYESERDAHQHTRDAYALQGERLQVAVESGKVTEQLLLEARRHAVAKD